MPSEIGSSLSSWSSTAFAAAVMASSRVMGIDFEWRMLGGLERHGFDHAVRGGHDLVDARLGFRELGLAVPAQQGAAFIGVDRVVELALAVLEFFDDRFELLDGVLETHGRDVVRQRAFSHVGYVRSRWAAGVEAPVI